MKKYKGYVQTNIVGSKCPFEFEVEDDATEEEIEQTGIVEWWYEEVTE